MKTLEEFLKSKASERAAAVAAAESRQAEEGKALEKQNAAEQAAREAESRAATEQEIRDLSSKKHQLALLKESLAMEVEGKGAVAEKRKKAEQRIDDMAQELERVGLSKDELLTNSEYRELEEVRNILQAHDEEAVFASPSIESDELKNKLESLGIEVPEQLTEETVTAALEQALTNIDTAIFETRLKLPDAEERERVIADIAQQYDFALKSLDVGTQHSFQSDGKGVLKDVEQELEEKLRAVPILTRHPELRGPIITAVITNALLSKNPGYQEVKQIPPTDIRYGTYVNAKAEAENAAQQQANRFREYLELKETKDPKEIEAARAELNEHEAELKEISAAAELFTGVPGEFRIENGRLLDTVAEARYTKIATEKLELEQQLAQAEDDLRELAKRPTSIFSSSKTAEWDKRNANLSKFIQQKRNELLK
jgi:hypothetical protein